MTDKNEHIINIELITKFLAGETNSAQEEQLNTWRKASDKNEQEFQSIKKLWNATYLNQGNQRIDIDREWNIFQNKIKPTRKTINLKPILAIAASFVLLFTLSIVGYRYIKTQTIQTSKLETIQTELPDGSLINLNNESRIKYTSSFNKKNRNIQLKGEGFFNVSSNKNLPFKIETEGLIIEVVGTKFNVNAYESLPDVKVSVVEGRVWIYAQHQATDTLILNAGETGIFKKEKRQTEKLSELDLNALGWNPITYNFNDATLTEVVYTLTNAYHIEFELDENIRDCKITVLFDHQKLGSILKVLKTTLDLEVNRNGDKIHLSGKGCN